MPDGPDVISPLEHAVFRADKMGKSTLFESPRILVGLNAFEPGQDHRLHTHEGMDKVYIVISGSGHFLLDDKSMPAQEGELLVAPEGVPHGVRNSSDERLVLLAILAPSPGA